MLLDLGGTGLGELSGLVLVTPSRVASVTAGNSCRGFFYFSCCRVVSPARSRMRTAWAWLVASLKYL